MEYDANGPPAVLSSGPTPCPSRPPKKPPYSKQCGNTNLHGMSPYESLQAHVHEVEPMVVSDDDSTDDLNHDDDDLYDASYEMDPFNIDTPVDNIKDFASKFTPCLGMNEKVHMSKDKWFGLSQKTKELCDQIDDSDKLASPSSSPSRPLGRPPFPPKQRCSINLHDMSAYEFLQVHTHELEPDPAPDEAITGESPILDSRSWL
jgi:hypothetical protein